MLNDKILKRFRQLLVEIHDEDTYAFTLASVDDSARPTQRIMTLLEVDLEGLVFYSNCKSRKGLHFAQRPWASACFYWHSIHQQVLFEGSIAVVDQESASTYWNDRGRSRQISAWASQQSRPLESKQQLLDSVEQVKNKFRNALIPPAPDWRAYRLIPQRVEFWKSGWNRLHERVCYQYIDDTWHQHLLYP